ncbi:unnamed protein product [Closterium sp. Yama58-4]|nr:unnamed protein product [Closterium sp. Yama58-4]
MSQSSCSCHMAPQFTAPQQSHEAPSLRLPPAKRLRLFGQQIQTSPVVAQPASDCSPCDIARSALTSPTSQTLSGSSSSSSTERLPPPLFPLFDPSMPDPTTEARYCTSDPCHVSSSTPSLSDLGDDILRQILQAMRPTAWDLSRLACVSVTWKNLCYSRQFWTKLRIGSGAMHPGMAKLAPRCRSLTDLFIDDPRCELHVLNPIIVACASSLRRVVLDCDSIAAAAVAAAPGPAAAAAAAAGNGAPRGNAESSICNLLWLISLHCRNVSKIELLSSRASAAAAAADSARTGAGNGVGNGATNGAANGASTSSAFAILLESRLMWFLTTAFRGIRHFSCVLPNSMTTQTTCLMAIAWRRLSSLRLHCGALQFADLLALRKCGGLKSLELVGGKLEDTSKTADASLGFGSQGQPEEGERLASLEVLVLNGCDYDPVTVANLAWHAPKLQRIVVKGESRDISAAKSSFVTGSSSVLFSRNNSSGSSSSHESSTVGESIAVDALPSGRDTASLQVTPILSPSHARAMVAASITVRAGNQTAGDLEWLAGIVEALTRQNRTGAMPVPGSNGTNLLSADPFARLRSSLSEVGRGHVRVGSPQIAASMK